MKTKFMFVIVSVCSALFFTLPNCLTPERGYVKEGACAGIHYSQCVMDRNTGRCIPVINGSIICECDIGRYYYNVNCTPKLD